MSILYFLGGIIAGLVIAGCLLAYVMNKANTVRLPW